MLARELGSGAFSVVKLAVNIVSRFTFPRFTSLIVIEQETAQKTAVKIVSKKKLSDEDYTALMMEIQILTELNHPHIIKLDFC